MSILAKVGPEEADRLRIAAWGDAESCAASCSADETFVAGVALGVPGVPDRSTKEASMAVIRAAVTARDLGRASLVMPILLDPRLGPRITKDPDGFWKWLSGTLDTFDPGRCHQDGGVWTIDMPRGRASDDAQRPHRGDVDRS